MAVFKTKQGALFMGREANFGAGLAENDLDYVEVSDVDFGALGNEWRDEDVVTQEDTDDDGMIARVPGERGFTFPLVGLMPDWPDSESTSHPGAAAHPLESVLEDGVAGGFGTAQGVPTTTVVTLDTGEGASFEVGQLAFVRTGEAGSYRVMMSRIKEIDGDELTLSPPLPAAPVATDLVFGSFSMPKAGASLPASSYELLWKGAAETDVRRARGCVCSGATLTAEPRGAAKLQMRYAAALLDDPDDCIADGYTGAPGTQEWLYPKIGQVIDGGFYVYNGTSLIKIDGQVSVDFGVELVANDGFSADDPNGIREYVRVARKIRVSMNPAYRNNDLISLFKNPTTTLQIVAWWGTGAGVFGFAIPNAVLLTPRLGDRDGYVSQELEFGCRGYTGDVEPVSATTLYNAPFVAGWLWGAIS